LSASCCAGQLVVDDVGISETSFGLPQYLYVPLIKQADQVEPLDVGKCSSHWYCREHRLLLTLCCCACGQGLGGYRIVSSHFAAENTALKASEAVVGSCIATVGYLSSCQGQSLSQRRRTYFGSGRRLRLSYQCSKSLK